MMNLSVVKYINSAPLYWGLTKGNLPVGLNVDFCLPSECAESIKDGDSVGGIIPSIEYARIDDLSIPVPLCISSKGRAGSVLLFSHKPLHELKTISIDNASRSSNALLHLLCKKYWKNKAKLISNNEARKDGFLVIGDEAIKLSQTSSIPFVYDLGEEWYKWTGLPFVFALWACRKDTAGDIAPILMNSYTIGQNSKEEIISHFSAGTGLRKEFLRDYLSDIIRYNLGGEEIKGLRLFYSMAMNEGLLKKISTINIMT